MKKIILFILFLVIIFPNHIMAKDNFIKTETKDKIMYISSSDGKFSYSWTFDRDYLVNFDMKINFVSPNKNLIDSLDNSKKEYVSFNYHGSLPGVATIKVPITRFEDNSRLKLYYYDEINNKIELIDDNVIVKNGYVTFEIDHCSDYFFKASVINSTESNNTGGIVIVAMIIIIVAMLGYILFKKD